MAELGCYVTNEYGILKLIFSHLSSKDLKVASKVCREWEDVAKRVLTENNMLHICNFYNTRINKPWNPFHKKIQPKVILHFGTSTRPEVMMSSEFIKELYETYNIDVPVYSIMNKWYITTNIWEDKVEICNERDYGSQTLILFPESLGIDINAFTIDIDDRESVTKSKALLTNSKCWILIARAAMNSVQKVRRFMQSLDNVENLVMAGGMAPWIAHRTPRSERQSGSSTVAENMDIVLHGKRKNLAIAFSGDNVSAHSDVHEGSSGDLNTFLKKFAERVGPKPEGAERIAFMFICVNRASWSDEEETAVFAKHFPSVPVFGYWSLGEYCIKNQSDFSGDDVEQKPKKAKCDNSKQEFYYQECTSVIVITFHKTSS